MTLASHLSGRVVTGLGEGAGFTQLDWAREQFIRKLGIDPYPGTLNLILETATDLDAWSVIRASPCTTITPPDSSACCARCFPVRITGQRRARGDGVPGAIVLPEVLGYPLQRLELIASASLRKALSLNDGDTVLLHLVPLIDNAALRCS